MGPVEPEPFAPTSKETLCANALPKPPEILSADAVRNKNRFENS